MPQGEIERATAGRVGEINSRPKGAEGRKGGPATHTC